MKRQNRKMREDIDHLLHQYLPLDKANNMTAKPNVDRANLLSTSEQMSDGEVGTQI